MKNIFLFFTVFAVSTAFSQITNTFPPNGNVGIGTTSPTQKLHVKGYGYFDTSPAQVPLPPTNVPGVLINPVAGAIELGSNNYTYSYIDFKGKNNTNKDYMGRIQYADTDGFNFYNTNTSGSPFVAMTILNTGMVGIGTQNPDELLTVKGKIHAEEVKVDLAVPADYVFQKYYTGFSELNPKYEMPDLQNTESYLKTHYHLPGLPSAKEIQENGMELGKMNNLLLEKIEELTLYIIEQDKRIQVLEAKLQEAE